MRFSPSLKTFGIVILAALFMVGAFTSVSQAKYPERPITLICPWAAGGGTDAVSRILATLLKKELGVPVNVVNQTGGSGAVGHVAMATAKPDGYTIGMPTFEITTMHWLGLTEVSYKDMVPICLVNADPSGISVRADSQWKTYKDLEKYVKANPGKLQCSGTGVGGSWHLGMAGWLIGLGMKPSDIKWIPSRGAAPALQDLVAGGIDLVTCSFPEAATLIEAKKVRPLAIMAAKRDPKFPDVPTLKEMGIDWKVAAWRGIAAPKGTSKEIVAVLEKAIAKVHKSPQFIKFMNDRGYAMEWMDTAQFAKYMPEEDRQNGAVIKAMGLTK
ncbi:MAG: Bug family tripartite tricarboxylate transporter substrate binding protein [Planctomycetaceae bacterium]